MPLFELYRMAKAKLDSSQEERPSYSTDSSFVPESDFVELVWENGQVLMQGQSSRTRRSPNSNSLPSHCLPSHDPKTTGNETNTKIGKFGMMDTGLDNVPTSMPSGGMNLNQDDDDMVPWLNYPIDESLPQDYCPDFLPELSGVTVNEPSNKNNFSLFDKRSRNNQHARNSNTFSVHNGVSLEQGNASKVSTAGGGEAVRPLSSCSQIHSLSSQQCQKFPYFKSRDSDNIGDSSRNASNHTACENSTQVPALADGFPRIKVRKQDTFPVNNNLRIMNFSHFSRPAALLKANLQTVSPKTCLGLSSIEKMNGKDKRSAASYGNLADSNFVDSFGSLRKETSPHSGSVILTSTVDMKPLASEGKLLDKSSTCEQLETVRQDDALKNDEIRGQIHGESSTKGVPVAEKASEPVIAASSVCSGNSVDRASDDPTHNLKRKGPDTEESECPSEDVEEESVGVKKVAPTRAAGSKRSRAAEVHNLSERRRRDRINEKMHALQELIPNCSKVDKASMLDEAIEYLKTLQLQVQIMSMGAGLYMPPMMLPTGMQHMHPAHLGHFSSMGVGMGMGMGMGFGMGGMPDMNGGSSSCPMVQVPPMHGSHFPGPPISVPTALQGIPRSNLQLFGLPGQVLPLSMPRPPLFPMSAGHIMNSSMGLNGCGAISPINNLDSATASTSKDMVQNIDSQVLQNTGGSSSMNQTSDQCQATNEKFEQSTLVQDNGQTSEGTGNGPFMSANGNEDIPSYD